MLIIKLKPDQPGPIGAAAGAARGPIGAAAAPRGLIMAAEAGALRGPIAAPHGQITEVPGSTGISQSATCRTGENERDE